MIFLLNYFYFYLISDFFIRRIFYFSVLTNPMTGFSSLDLLPDYEYLKNYAIIAWGAKILSWGVIIANFVFLILGFWYMPKWYYPIIFFIIAYLINKFIFIENNTLWIILTILGVILAPLFTTLAYLCLFNII